MRLLLLVLISMILVNLRFERSIATPEIGFNGAAIMRYADVMEYGAGANSFLRSGFFTLRIRPIVDIKLDSDTDVVFEPQFAKIFGRDYSYAQTDSSGARRYNEALNVHEGYIRLKIGDELKFIGGRMILDYGSGVLLGHNDASPWGRSFDLVKVEAKSAIGNADLIHAVIKNTANSIDADKNLEILYLHSAPVGTVQSIDVYSLYESDQTLSRNEFRYVTGTRLTLKSGQTDFNFETAWQRGSSLYQPSETTGSMAVFELGQTWDVAGPFRAGLEINFANMDWVEWYPTTKPLLGRNDVVGRRNLTSSALRLSTKPSDAWTIKVDYWTYFRTSETQPAYRVDGLPVGSTSLSGSKDIGSAIEVSVHVKSTKNLEYGVGLAYLEQGSYLKECFGNRALTDAYALINVLF